jgi:hypothetical protein
MKPVGVAEFLMRIKNPAEEIKLAVKSAAAWLKTL